MATMIEHRIGFGGSTPIFAHYTDSVTYCGFCTHGFADLRQAALEVLASVDWEANVYEGQHPVDTTALDALLKAVEGRPA